MHIDWKKELRIALAKVICAKKVQEGAYMLPPSSLICIVTTISPIHTRAKTPENTVVFCSLDTVIDSSKLSNRQKMRGPLYTKSMMRFQEHVDNPTTNPSLSNPYSFRPRELGLHPTTFPWCFLICASSHSLEASQCLQRIPPYGVFQQVRASAKVLVAFFPILLVYPLQVFPKQIRRWYWQVHDDPHPA